MLEIACFNSASAAIAQANGAHRVELCADRGAGGITPSRETFLNVKQQLTIPVFVMIRPRAGNFVYSQAELEQMLNDINWFAANGADGFVFGILNADSTMNIVACRQLLQAASPLPSTFHRAFDEMKDTTTSLHQLIEVGFQNILTSGGKATAEEGAPHIAKLIQVSAGRITVMPGGGIRSANIRQIASLTGAKWFHSAALSATQETTDAAEVESLLTQLKR